NRLVSKFSSGLKEVNPAPVIPARRMRPSRSSSRDGLRNSIPAHPLLWSKSFVNAALRRQPCHDQRHQLAARHETVELHVLVAGMDGAADDTQRVDIRQAGGGQVVAVAAAARGMPGDILAELAATVAHQLEQLLLARIQHFRLAAETA